MRQSINIFQKEFRSYFVTPIAYIVIAIFLLVTGWFFFATFFSFRPGQSKKLFFLAAGYLLICHSGGYHAIVIRGAEHRLL